jgi:hypothetical protein
VRRATDQQPGQAGHDHAPAPGVGLLVVLGVVAR